MSNGSNKTSPPKQLEHVHLHSPLTQKAPIRLQQLFKQDALPDSICAFWSVAFQRLEFNPADMKMPLRNRVGARVKALRLLTGLSQEALADRCGFARSYMSRIERGTANLSLDALERLSEALNIPEHDFFVFPEHDMTKRLVVPYAADGSYFHPGLASSRDGSFRVGEKHAPVRFRSFEEALAHLAGMPVAKWWRPNAAGHRGLVSAVEWKELPIKEPI